MFGHFGLERITGRIVGIKFSFRTQGRRVLQSRHLIIGQISVAKRHAVIRFRIVGNDHPVGCSDVVEFRRSAPGLTAQCDDAIFVEADFLRDQLTAAI